MPATMALNQESCQLFNAPISNVKIGKIMLVGTPNVGTPLANPTDLPDAVSR